MQSAEAKTESLSETIGASFLAGIMVTRDLSARDMDNLCGLRTGHFGEARTKNFPGEQLRALIENRLRVRIWESEQRFNLRMACQRKYNFDPCLLTIPELRRWTRQLDLTARLRPNASRDQLIEAVLQHLAANPKSLCKSNPGTP
jgi:hypothetical protein